MYLTSVNITARFRAFQSIYLNARPFARIGHERTYDLSRTKRRVAGVRIIHGCVQEWVPSSLGALTRLRFTRKATAGFIRRGSQPRRAASSGILTPSLLLLTMSAATSSASSSGLHAKKYLSIAAN